MANNNTFQIVGGEYRSRKFSFVDTQGLRPTPGKVRETLFNWIQFEAHNKTYLDAFAGSGALGFEALSRGAKKVLSLEKNPKAFESLQKNWKKLQSDKMQILNQDVFHYLAQKSETTFDFVFLDPPFGHNYLEKTLKLLARGNFVAPKSKIYIESEFEITNGFLHKNFSEKIKINKQKQTGAVFYCLCELL